MSKGVKIAIFSVIGVIVLLVLIGSASDSPTPSPTPVVENTTEENVVEAEPVEAESEDVGQVEGTTTPGEEAKVVRVIDGDTFEIEGGQTIRIITTDTPETVHPSQPVECMGKEASAKTKELIEGKTVRLEKDVSETDRYGRLLRYVYLEDGRMLNEVLIQEGFANAVSHPPDVKYLDRLRAAEQSAKNNKWGLWSGVCDTVAPVTNTQPTKAPTTQTAPKTTVAPKPAANCSANTYNCTDFSTCAEAKAVFNQCSNDVHGLDRDQDGIPCDTLCQ
ncbi:MAG: thermonuclease family protein [Candidatus Andersenbacteria bacterium]